MFRIKSGVPAPEFTGDWSPDLHFTGSYGKNVEVEAMQSVIDTYQEGLIAYYLYSPFSGLYSLELQWSPGHRDNMLACLQAYCDLFTPKGNLKKKYK